MSPQQIALVEECAAASLSGAMTFPDVLGKLASIGIERYHADYCRSEMTYYLPDGSSHTVALKHAPLTIAPAFSAAAIEAAIRASQRGEIRYAKFLRRSSAAGCVGYFVQLTGRRVLYFGRTGDLHIEPFPQ